MSKQPSKRSLTLDLNAPGSSKRARIQQVAPILTTPDVQMLKLSSPELAKFLTSNNTLATPTPSGYLFPKTVTEEQELYAKGFVDALEAIRKEKSDGGATGINQTAISTIEKATAAHRQTRNSGSTNSNATINLGSTDSSKATEKPQLPVTVELPISSIPSAPVISRPSSGASGSIDSSEGNNNYGNFPEGVRVKEEAEDSSVSTDEGSNLNTSNMSPIDMASQEKIKLERKRMRNRVAASKCRKRKLEKISLLDDKVSQLKGENSELAAVVKKLKAAVCELKQEVMEHMNHGCQIMMSDMAGF